MASPSSQTLLVTGASGYIGGHIIKQALEKGYNVRAAARSESSGESLRETFSDHSTQFSYTVVSDITKPESYENTFGGNVSGVIHLASPFVFDVNDNKKDLLDPAVAGAVGILEAAKRYSQGSVRRVVVTASFASINDVTKGQRPDYTYSEKDWNPMTYDEAATAESMVAYAASKGLAEWRMWEWLKSEQPSFSLATICPGWVFGPHVPRLTSVGKLNQSTKLLWNLIGAKEIPPFDFGVCVDVRDVAAAHIAAIEKDNAGGERFICGQHFDWQAVVDVARAAFPELQSRIPAGETGRDLSKEIYKVDGSKLTKVLGIQYVGFEQIITDSFQELLEAEKAST